jgi:hypothetical protein
MARRLRFVLICILTMVVPVHGMASALMLLCAPAGRITAPATVHDRSMHGGVAQAEQIAQHGGDKAASDDAAALPHHAGHKCSACASSCSGFALPSVTVALTIPDHVGAEFPPLLAAVPELVMPGPERPPRGFPA